MFDLLESVSRIMTPYLKGCGVPHFLSEMVICNQTVNEHATGFKRDSFIKGRDIPWVTIEQLQIQRNSQFVTNENKNETINTTAQWKQPQRLNLHDTISVDNNRNFSLFLVLILFSWQPLQLTQEDL